MMNQLSNWSITCVSECVSE